MRRGFLPSVWWTPGTLIVEESGIRGEGAVWGESGRLSLQLYAADSLEKLPVVATQAGVIADDGQSLKLSFPLFWPEFGVTPEN